MVPKTPPAHLRPALDRWGEAVPVHQARGARWGELLDAAEGGEVRLIVHEQAGALAALADVATAGAVLHLADLDRVASTVARTNLGDLVRATDDWPSTVYSVITRHGRDVAVLVSARQLEARTRPNTPIALGEGTLDVEELVAQGLAVKIGGEELGQPEEPGAGWYVVARVYDEHADPVAPTQVAMGVGHTVAAALADLTRTPSAATPSPDGGEPSHRPQPKEL